MTRKSSKHPHATYDIVTQLHDTYLGGRVLCKEKTYFQDTYDHAVAHSYYD